MSLLFVFGSPGVGKSYVSRVIQELSDFFYYDADADLTDDMIEAIQQERVFTDDMRQNYFNIVIRKTKQLIQENKNVVVAQALIKEANRQQVLGKLPKIQLVHITANINVVNQRLKIRDNWVSIEYASKIRAAFEKPLSPHITIDNNHDKQHVVNQLNKFLL